MHPIYQKLGYLRLFARPANDLVTGTSSNTHTLGTGEYRGTGHSESTAVKSFEPLGSTLNRFEARELVKLAKRANHRGDCEPLQNIAGHRWEPFEKRARRLPGLGLLPVLLSFCFVLVASKLLGVDRVQPVPELRCHVNSLQQKQRRDEIVGGSSTKQHTIFAKTR